MIELYTSEQWCNRMGIPRRDILDPDGWDRNNWFQSWWVEKITEEEFVSRLMKSTLCGIKNILEKINEAKSVAGNAPTQEAEN